jgi:hypothetical protein
MPITILPPEGGLGQSVGLGFGSGLGSLLKGAAEGQNKLALAQQFEQQGLPGTLAYLDPQVQAHYLRNAQAAQIEAQKQANLADLLENVLGAGEKAQPAVPQQQDQEQALLQQLRLPGGLAQAQLGKRLAQPEFQTLPTKDKIPFSEPSERVNITREKQLSDEMSNLESGLRNPKLSGIEKKALREELKDRRKEFTSLSQELRKESKAELKQMREKDIGADDRLKSLERLEQLEDEGLILVKTNEALRDLGWDVGALKNPASEEAQAIIQGFARDAKTFYGTGRLTNTELELFMQSLPNLSQTPEGRKRVVSRMKDFARLEKATYKEARNVIAKNANVPPADLWEKVDSRLDKQRDKFAQAFKRDLQRKVPEPEGRAGIVASKIATGVLKQIPKALGGFGLLKGLQALRGLAG